MVPSYCTEIGKVFSLQDPCRVAPKQPTKLTDSELQEAQTIQQAIVPEYAFWNLQLLLQALTHKSYPAAEDNETLEFLGDAVLSFVLTEHLVATYQATPEIYSETLQLLRSNETLAIVGKNLNIGKHIRRSTNEQFLGPPNDRLIASTIEALIGAIFQDTGIESARQFILSHIPPLLPQLLEPKNTNTDGLDNKSALQKYAEKSRGITPLYKVISAINHYPNTETTVAVYLGGTEIARATGRNKKVAGQRAAKAAIDKLKAELGHE